MTYFCQCGQPAIHRINTEVVIVDGKKKTIRGLGTWRCPKGCRRPRMSLAKGYRLRSKINNDYENTPVHDGFKTPVRREG